MQAAAGNLKRVSLALGGKSPAIVFPDANLDHAIGGVADAIFYNQGQCCTAGSRLFAHKSVYDKVVEGMVNKAGKIKVGHGLDPSVRLGPLVSKEQHTKVQGFIESGRKEGATVETGGGVVGNQGYFMEPTVLTKTNRDMKVVREEIFGPVVCVQSFDDDNLDQVAKFANDTEYGLQASIWTHNLRVAHSLARKIKAGTICVNSHNYGDPAWPFGGFKQSGWDREMGKEVMEHYTETEVGRDQPGLRTGVRGGRCLSPRLAPAVWNLPLQRRVSSLDNSQGEFLMDAVRETSTLIAADKVQGTDVFNNGGDRLGSVHDLMIDKQTGQVAYAIMSFGGFLGIGNSYHPLPWSLLRYNTNLGGYVVEIDDSQLRDAPSYPIGTEPAWGDPEYEGKLQDYYGVGVGAYRTIPGPL